MSDDDEAQNSVIELKITCYRTRLGVYSSLHQSCFRFSSIFRLFQFAKGQIMLKKCPTSRACAWCPAGLQLPFKHTHKRAGLPFTQPTMQLSFKFQLRNLRGLAISLQISFPPDSLRMQLRDWLSTHSCMPLQQLPTVTKDANAHARLGYVRSQSLLVASTTTSPVETRGRLGKLLPRRHSRTLAKLKVHH